MRKFIVENNVCVQFDPFWVFYEGFQTGMHLMRFESFGDLYPVTTIPTLGPLHLLLQLYLPNYSIVI